MSNWMREESNYFSLKIKESFETFQQLRPNLSLLPPMERQMYQSLTTVFGTELIEQQARTEVNVSE